MILKRLKFIKFRREYSQGILRFDLVNPELINRELKYDLIVRRIEIVLCSR